MILNNLSKSDLQKLGQKMGLFITGLDKHLLTEKISNSMCHHFPHIAFCFLVYSHVEHGKIWEKFFKQDMYGTANIYSHIKENNSETQEWLLPGQARTVHTEWCGENLVKAFCQMLKKALLNTKNEYFCLLSGSCIPLKNYEKTYDSITKLSKSSMCYWKVRKSVEPILGASQWVILNRECASDLLKLYKPKNKTAKKFLKKIRKIRKSNMQQGLQSHCPDELYPINWFSKLYGNNLSKKIKNQVTTYVLWEDYNDNPTKLNQKKVDEYYTEICQPNHLFARKFYKTTAKNIAMQCD